MRKVLLALLALPLCGCLTNNYEEFYVDMTDSGRHHPADTQTNQGPVILKAVTTEDDVIDLLEDGYVVLGRSSFQGPYTPFSCAVDTAEAHGATLVLLDVRYKESKTYTSVMFLPSYSTSYTQGTGTATAYSGGSTTSVFGSYSGTTTTTTMNAVPVQQNQDIYCHDAMFLRKLPSPWTYGAILRVPERLPGEEADARISIVIQAVLHGSKAENDGLRRGQIVAKINGKDIKTRNDVWTFVRNPSLVKKVEVAK